MAIGEPREPQLNTEFDPERHVKIPDRELPEEEKGRGSFVTKEAYETQRLAEAASSFNLSRQRGETKPERILEEQARQENAKRYESESEKTAQEVRGGKLRYQDLEEARKRDLDVIIAALDYSSSNFKYIPEDLREKISNLASGKDIDTQGPK